MSLEMTIESIEHHDGSGTTSVFINIAALGIDYVWHHDSKLGCLRSETVYDKNKITGMVCMVPHKVIGWAIADDNAAILKYFLRLDESVIMELKYWAISAPPKNINWLFR
jgi:hypothetical protein